MRSIHLRRVHKLQIRRQVGGQPISRSSWKRILTYASSMTRSSPEMPGMKNAVTPSYSPRSRASSLKALLTAAGWIRASSSEIRLLCRDDSRCTESWSPWSSCSTCAILASNA